MDKPGILSLVPEKLLDSRLRGNDTVGRYCYRRNS